MSYSRTPVIDIHAHPVLKNYLLDYDIYKKHEEFDFFPTLEKTFNPLFMRTDLPKMKNGGIDVCFSSVYLPEINFIRNCQSLENNSGLIKFFFEKLWNKIENTSSSDRPFKQTKAILERFNKQIKKANTKGFKIKLAKSFNDVRSAVDNEELVYIHAIEGGHSLGFDYSSPNNYVDNLRTFHAMGVKSVTLAHFYPNDLTFCVDGLPAGIMKDLKCTHNTNMNHGLSQAGKAVVEEMFALNMLVDLTHLTPKARQDIYDINDARLDKRPLIFSHVGISEINNAPMNPTKDEILKIHDYNGLIGVIFSNYWLANKEDSVWNNDDGTKHILNTINQLKKITGTFDNIAIGTDLDGFTDPPDDLYDYEQFPELERDIQQSGMSQKDLSNILGGNMMRILEETW